MIRGKKRIRFMQMRVIISEEELAGGLTGVVRYLLSTDSLYYNQTLAPNISVFNMFNITTI
jgi:hypothetical protein